MFLWVQLLGCFFPSLPTTSTIPHLLPLICTCCSPPIFIPRNLEATVMLLRQMAYGVVTWIMFLTWRGEGIMILGIIYLRELSPSLLMRLMGSDCFSSTSAFLMLCVNLAFTVLGKCNAFIRRTLVIGESFTYLEAR